MAVLCFGLAMFAQRRLDRGLKDYRAFLSFGIAGLLFALSFGNNALERMPDPDDHNLAETPSKWAGSVGTAAKLLGIALLGCLDFWDNRFRPLGLILWGGGLCMCLCYLYLSDAPQRLGGQLLDFFANKSVTVGREWLLVALAVLVGAVLRLHQLGIIPADIGWDLPYNYTDVASILRGEYRIFFPANMGREGLFFYLAALVAHFAPLSHFSLKLTSALVGIATIPALYLLARRLFNPSVAFGAAFLLAVNRWHIVLSRAGFRVILLPLFVILLFHALVRALHSYRLFDFALAGLVLGLGLHAYLPFLLAPVAIVTGFALLVLSGRRLHWRSLLPLLAIMFAVALAVYAPLGRFAIEHRQEYLQRMALQTRMLKGEAETAAISLPAFAENLRRTLLMFNLYGDGNSRFNVPYFRHFGFVSGVLLVLGGFYALRRWRQGNNSVLLAVSFIFILPSALAALPNEMPNCFRAAGCIGPALTLAALPLPAIGKCLQDLSVSWPKWDVLVRFSVSSMGEVYESVWRIGRRSLLVLAPMLSVVLLLVLEGKETAGFYFHDFVNVLPDNQNVSVAKEMARQMEAYGDLSSCCIKLWPHWFDGRALRTYLRREEAEWGEFDDLVPGQPPLSSITERALFIVHPDDSEGLAVLRDAFPHCVTKPYLFPNGTPAFVLVYVER